MSETEPMVAPFDAFWKRFDEALAELPDAIRGDVIDALEPALVESRPPETHERAVMRDWRRGPKRFYAVHDADLLALKDAGATAGLTAGALLAAGVPGAQVIGLIAGFLMMRVRHRAVRVAITPEQATVLRRLSDAGPGGLTTIELMTRFDMAERFMLSTAAEVEPVLESLRDVVKGNGASTCFVAERGGRWRAVDV